ncbi:FadR/GntR family transcriptional regulator [Lichenicoccus sp.]|uniref:FadR/GntR family transcriptional regulator n=1 Tax=Lichenicoccus sp. TaxID=2781899 RepID=UPI003D14C726
MTLKLDRLSRGPHLPALVASSISREIAEGRLRPGDRLPTEQSLAGTFGVSRNVVREAIARLRFEGLIWSQQGRGAFVSDATTPVVLQIEPSRTPAAELFASLFQVREMIEVPAAALAAGLRDGADLERMRVARNSMAAAPYGSIAWLEGDLEFHRAIAASTRNAYIQQIVGFTAERVRESILAAGNRARSDDMAQATLSEHERILEAIAAADPEAAGTAMRAHLGGAMHRIGLPAAGAAVPPATARAAG